MCHSVLGPSSRVLEAYNPTTTTRTGKCLHNCPSKSLIISSNTLISTVFAQLHAYAPRFGCPLNFGSSDPYISDPIPTLLTAIIATRFYLLRIYCNTHQASRSQLMVLCSGLLSTPCCLIYPRCPASEIWISLLSLMTVRGRYPHWKAWVRRGN